MAININTILDWFKSGKKPTEQQFADSWKSFWHKDDSIPQTAIENLETTLDEKATHDELQAHINDPDAHGGSGVIPTLDQVTQSAATSLKPITVQDINPSTGEKLSTVVYSGSGISYKPEGGNWTNLVLQSGSSDSITITVPASDNDETVAYQSYVDGFLGYSVPYTGAATDVDLGNHFFKAFETSTNQIRIQNAGSNAPTLISNNNNTGSAHSFTLPKQVSEDYTFLTLSVNGVPADENGNILLEVKGTQDLQSILDIGNTTAKDLIFTDTMGPKGLNGSTAGYLKFKAGNVLVGSNAIRPVTFKDKGIELPSDMTDGIKGLDYYGSGYTDNSFVQKKFVIDEMYNYMLYTPRPLFVSSSAASVVGSTDGTTEKILYTIYIPANTIANGRLSFNSQINNTGTAGSKTLRLRSNTTNTLTGASTLAVYTTASNTIVWMDFERTNMILSGTSLSTYRISDTTAFKDASVSSIVANVVTFNPTVDNYIFVTNQLSNTADSSIMTYCQLTFLRF